MSYCLVPELSEVLWRMGFHGAFTIQGVLGFLGAFFLFAFWAGEFFQSLLFFFRIMLQWLHEIVTILRFYCNIKSEYECKRVTLKKAVK